MACRAAGVSVSQMLIKLRDNEDFQGKILRKFHANQGKRHIHIYDNDKLAMTNI